VPDDWNVEDFEVVNSVDAQDVHEDVATQRSEEPVSRIRSKFCALKDHEYF
jgi:hypothetical protein